MIRRFVEIAAIFLLLVVIGCSHKVHVKQPSANRDHLIPAVSVSGPVAIIGQSQKQSGMFEFCEAGGRAYAADYEEFTTFAVEGIINILKRNGSQTVDSAAKQLVVSVSDASCYTQDFFVYFDVVLNVSMGNGLTKQFSGSERTSNIRRRHVAMSTATQKAVYAMFKDKEIMQYLEQ